MMSKAWRHVYCCSRAPSAHATRVGCEPKKKAKNGSRVDFFVVFFHQKVGQFGSGGLFQNEKQNETETERLYGEKSNMPVSRFLRSVFRE